MRSGLCGLQIPDGPHLPSDYRVACPFCFPLAPLSQTSAFPDNQRNKHQHHNNSLIPNPRLRSLPQYPSLQLTSLGFPEHSVSSAQLTSYRCVCWLFCSVVSPVFSSFPICSIKVLVSLTLDREPLPQPRTPPGASCHLRLRHAGMLTRHADSQICLGHGSQLYFPPKRRKLSAKIANDPSWLGSEATEEERPCHRQVPRERRGHTAQGRDLLAAGAVTSGHAGDGVLELRWETAGVPRKMMPWYHAGRAARSHRHLGPGGRVPSSPQSPESHQRHRAGAPSTPQGPAWSPRPGLSARLHSCCTWQGRQPWG